MATYINNHIHTDFSFSPYTPAEAARAASEAGLKTAGIMDHDTCAGSREFLEAARKAKIPATCGVECRVCMSGTALEGRRLNNPDQKSVAYVAMHGIPHRYFDEVDAFFAPYREKRNIRNRAMTERINALLSGAGIGLDFDRDVLPLSRMTVTERHILFALAKKILETAGSPSGAVSFLEGRLGLSLSAADKEKILSGSYTDYRVLGVLKARLVEKFYIDATDECPHVTEFIRMVRKYYGIAAYAYLGDVGRSVTGDKKAQKFEDDYIDLLFSELKRLGFDAVTFMPTRNTPDQLDRVMSLCREYGFFQISGEDINSPFQSFVCPAYADPKFYHLVDAAFTLIEYEKAASFAPSAAVKKYPQIFANRKNGTGL